MAGLSTYVVAASGPSLTAEQMQIASRWPIIAVSNVGLDYPECKALVSHDSAWWMAHPKAWDFKGRKFCRHHFRDIEQFVPSVTNGCNSGFMAMEVARDIFKAQRILLLGFDMHSVGGHHYFGRHPAKLKTTTPQRFEVHIKQFDRWRGPEVINCTPGSALTQFSKLDIHKIKM